MINRNEKSDLIHNMGQVLFFSANEYAAPRKGKHLCPRENKGARMFIALQFSHVNMHMPSVQSHQSYPVCWELLILHPNRPLADADALCG